MDPAVSFSAVFGVYSAADGFHQMGSIHQNGGRRQEPGVGDTRGSAGRAGVTASSGSTIVNAPWPACKSSSGRTSVSDVEAYAKDPSKWTPNMLRSLGGWW